jgi:hypothetical protein
MARIGDSQDAKSKIEFNDDGIAGFESMQFEAF